MIGEYDLEWDNVMQYAFPGLSSHTLSMMNSLFLIFLDFTLLRDVILRFECVRVIR